MARHLKLQEEIFKLEPHPFITTYQDWNSLNTLLTKFYSDAYMNAINLDSGRWGTAGLQHLSLAVQQTTCATVFACTATCTKARADNHQG